MEQTAASANLVVDGVDLVLKRCALFDLFFKLL